MAYYDRNDVVIHCSETGETELLSFDAAVKRWPWLKGYRKTLEAGVAVFAAEGQFAVDKGEAELKGDHNVNQQR